MERLLDAYDQNTLTPGQIISLINPPQQDFLQNCVVTGFNPQYVKANDANGKPVIIFHAGKQGPHKPGCGWSTAHFEIKGT